MQETAHKNLNFLFFLKRGGDLRTLGCELLAAVSGSWDAAALLDAPSHLASSLPSLYLGDPAQDSTEEELPKYLSH